MSRSSATKSTLALLLVVGLAGALPGAERVAFKELNPRAYRLQESGPRLLSAPGADEWLSVVSDDAAALPFKFGSRVVLQVTPGTDLNALLVGSPLRLVEEAAPGWYLLQAPHAREAMVEAQRLSALSAVLTSHPEMKRPVRLHRDYVARPNDPYFNQQWHLEYRASNGTRLGPDVNARAAWPRQTGAGVPIAVVDEGVDLAHPDLLAAVLGMPHYNFYADNTNGTPNSPVAAHGTAVAGLAAARGNNATGVSGVAREASIASWVIFDFNDVAGEGQLRDMFQFQSNTVPIQNHSWSYSLPQQLGPGGLELLAISNAVHFGREGKGVIMVRSGGNSRQFLVNANDDGYVNDPRIIAVGAVRQDGQNTSYSNPGACLLVAAPSGDTSLGFANLYTTDQVGSQGLNNSPPSLDTSNYTSFSGTSASAPLVSGIVGLMLEANPALTYRDAQQILIHAARHTDPGDPLMKTNQAGLRVNDNVGFGVPDAGRAVRLARDWPLRPALTNLVFLNEEVQQIPNRGLRVEVFGDSVPTQLASIVAAPGVGRHPEDLTPFYPLVDVGLATNTIPLNLTNKAALILRGQNTFVEKINFAAAAGARLAIIADNVITNSLVIMNGTQRAAIPAVFISGADGTALREYVATNGLVQARSILFYASYTNHVVTPLSLEHVGVRVKTDHSNRGDLRITVTSPAGTRSVLQQINDDQSGGPTDWTYWSTHHFHESSQGVWTIQISDERNVTFGNSLHTELILRGVPIKDQDRDGLDDDWELAYFGNLAARPHEDADDDGESNMAEFIQGTNPLSTPEPFPASISQWSPDYVRVAWPANLNREYQVLGGTDVTKPFTVLTNLPGTFDTGEWFTPSTNFGQSFFLIRSALP